MHIHLDLNIAVEKKQETASFHRNWLSKNDSLGQTRRTWHKMQRYRRVSHRELGWLWMGGNEIIGAFPNINLSDLRRSWKLTLPSRIFVFVFVFVFIHWRPYLYGLTVLRECEFVQQANLHMPKRFRRSGSEQEWDRQSRADGCRRRTTSTKPGRWAASYDQQDAISAWRSTRWKMQMSNRVTWWNVNKRHGCRAFGLPWAGRCNLCPEGWPFDRCRFARERNRFPPDCRAGSPRLNQIRMICNAKNTVKRWRQQRNGLHQSNNYPKA